MPNAINLGEPGVAEEEAEAAYDAFVLKNLKRNYTAHYLHGMLGMTGFRLFNAPTFLPAYLHMISGSNAIVGLGQALQQLGGIFSPIVGATHLEHRKQVLPVATIMGIGMRLQILGIALAGFFIEGQPLVATVLLFLFLFGIFSGAQSVAFQLLLAKVIPIARRGRLQALRNMTGGAIAAVLSWFAGWYFIENNVLGNGYGVTFLLAVGLTSLGLTALRVFTIEPEPPTIRAKSSLRSRAKDFPALLRDDRGFMFFMIAQTMAFAGRIAAPFYVLFATQTIALTGENLGYLSLCFLGADVVTNLAWGTAGDKFGFRATFIVSTALSIGAIVLLMMSDSLPMFLLSFFGLGASSSGLFMSTGTMVLEFGSREDVAMRLAMATTAQGFVATVGPLAGGVIATSFGYLPLFALTAVFLSLALVLLLTVVEEPRNRRLRRAVARK